MKLLPSQLNELYDLIVKSNCFSPSQFKKSDFGAEFQMIGTKYNFKIYNDSGSLLISFSPAEDSYEIMILSQGWEEVKVYFSKWLSYLKREVSAPDKWGRLLDEMKYLVGATEVKDENFSHAEYIALAANVEQIKNSLHHIPLLEEQDKGIKRQLDHLLELTSELNKFDWQNLFIGTIVSVIIQLQITPENAALLRSLIKNTFEGLFIL